MVRRSGILVLVGLAWLVGSAGASPEDVRTLSRNLKRAVGSQDREAVQGVLEDMLAVGGEDAMEEILELIPRLRGGSNEIYWQLVTATTGFRDRAALIKLGEEIVDNDRQPYTRDLVFGLENNTSPFVVDALRPILLEGAYDLQLMAADQLARVQTVASVDALIEVLRQEGEDLQQELQDRVVTSLMAITGETTQNPVNWIGWWEANRQNGIPERGGDSHAGGGGMSSSTRGMDPNRAREFGSLTRDPRRIVVISSRLADDHPIQPGRNFDYDHMEHVLDQMDIPHTVVLKDEFEEDPGQYLRDAWTVLVNCNNIQTMCVCEECGRILAEKRRRGEDIGGTNNRLYGCPPECSVHDRQSYRMNAEAVAALEAWVEEGGYLFTEDWGIVEIVETAWPELVNTQKSNGPNGNPQSQLVMESDVEITPGRGMTSTPLLRGVFARPRPPAREGDADDEGGTMVRDMNPADNPAAGLTYSWHIDDESPAIHVEDERNVTILMESEDLGRLAQGDRAVAVTFRVGSGRPWTRNPEARERPVTGGGRGGSRTRGGGGGSTAGERAPGGRVLHVMSHFGKQQSSQRDTFVLQNLILNFIMESNMQHGG